MTELFSAILGTLIGALLSHRLTVQNDRTRLTLEFHKEWNSFEMSQIRRKADDCIRKYPDTNYNELRNKDEDGSIAVFIILRFYQRIWQSINSNSFNNQLAADLFHESYYYWYFMSFQMNLIPLSKDWLAGHEMKFLFSFMTNHTSFIALNNSETKYSNYLTSRIRSLQ